VQALTSTDVSVPATVAGDPVGRSPAEKYVRSVS